MPYKQDPGRPNIGRKEAQSSSSYQSSPTRSNADAIETRNDQEQEIPRVRFHAQKSVPRGVSFEPPMSGIKSVRVAPQQITFAVKSSRQDGNLSDNTNARSVPVRTAMEPPQSLPRRIPITSSTKSTFPQNEDRFHSQHRASFPMTPVTPGSRMRSIGSLGRKSVLATSHVSEIQQRTPNPSHMISSPSSHAKGLISKPTKSTNYIVPMWQYEDVEHDARVKHMAKKPSDFEPRTRLGSNKRTRDSTVSAMSAAVRRMSVKARSTGGNQAVIRDRGPELTRLKGVIAPNLFLTNDGNLDDPDSDDSMGDNVRFQPQPKTALRKVIQSGQSATKRVRSARKVESVDAPSEEQEESSTSSNPLDEVNNRNTETTHAEADKELEKIPVPLDPPPKIHIPINQIAPEVRPPSPPTENLVAAIKLLTLAPFIMQKRKQLPFLRRQVQLGFISRCKSLGVPTAKVASPVSLLVRYEYAGETSYETTVNSWLCPLCEIHDTFNTREMLACHLKWDHAEVFVEWDKSSARSQILKWVVKILIPEPLDESMLVPPDSRLQTVQPEQTVTPAVDSVIPSSAQSLPVNLFSPSTQETSIKPEQPATPPRISLKKESIDSLFPFVTLSPAPAPTVNDVEALSEKLKHQETYYPTPTPHTSQSARSTSSRVRSTATPSASLRLSGRKPRLSNGNFPVPPPPDDPLGPAARRPYLPAKSDYGGPTVYYSCRPGGECLYDLLGTLPMEQFGVLDWAVLDREEEIYEADDVIEEYKIMHALWARWIFLNRNKFIASYYQGTVAFVNEYWKMIHRAAGWDALRYWLLMLLANRFLTGADVADVLKHYEGLTGMDSWYD